MTTITRRSFAASAAFAALASTSLLHSNTAAADGVKFDYWHRSGGKAGEAWNTLAKVFSDTNTSGYTVTAINQGDIQELNQKVRAAAAGGGLPGASMADDYDVAQYAAADIIVDVDTYMQDPKLGLSKAQQDAFLPAQLNRHKLPLYGGKRMAMPLAFSAFSTWWNVEALQKAGFDGPPATWPEFPDFARKVGKANPGVPVWVIGGAGDRFMSVMKTSGIEWLKEDGTANFDHPGVVEIMTWWKELSDEKLLQIAQKGASDVFASGKSLMFMDSSANVTFLTENVKGFTFNGGLPPQGANATRKVTDTYGPVSVIPRNDDALMEAGWQWLKWLTTQESYDIWIPTTSYFPAVPGVAKQGKVKEFYDKNPIAKKMLDEVAPYAEILSASPALTEVRGSIVANVVNEVLLGKYTPDEGVQKMQADANDAIKRASGK